ncbi:hypothetical protein [Nonomuraea sp. NPDC049750]|uniref:hypothetical protein n=1 Tax=Nonomuraea sp. NPDC049750 TaxID=3154738 RepID=UPI0033D32F31
MAELIERLQEVITVERSQFILKDHDGDLDEPNDWPPPWEVAARLPNSWFEATLNWAILCSEEPWHDTEVTLELWDGPPLDDTESWHRSKVSSFYSSSGIVYLTELYGGEEPSLPLDLRRSASQWTIRASSRPGTGWSWPDELEPPRGIEEWRVQFWPPEGHDYDLSRIRRVQDSRWLDDGGSLPGGHPAQD